ncbi:MAG: hypothetical protein U9N72_05630 [Bacteroidota bacterium]|nr:hypothetical protein [Bacteroidota bacterium]
MKALNWIAWISGGIGLVFVLMGLIQIVFQVKIVGGAEIVNYFHVANSFILITIALFVFLCRYQWKKE